MRHFDYGLLSRQRSHVSPFLCPATASPNTDDLKHWTHMRPYSTNCHAWGYKQIPVCPISFWQVPVWKLYITKPRCAYWAYPLPEWSCLHWDNLPRPVGVPLPPIHKQYGYRQLGYDANFQRVHKTTTNAPHHCVHIQHRSALLLRAGPQWVHGTSLMGLSVNDLKRG